jgi:hypothetical protein
MKKLTDFAWDEINEIDYMLYHFYEYKEMMTADLLHRRLGDKTKSNSMFHNMEDMSKIWQHLHTLGKYNYITNSIDSYYISIKGKILCEQGGLVMLWERQKSNNKSLLLGIIAIIISGLALIFSAIPTFLKDILPLLPNCQ